MNLPALIRSSQQDVYMSLTILGCTVNCRFRFADCPLIHCVPGQFVDIHSPDRLSDHDIVSGTLKVVIPPIKNLRGKCIDIRKVTMNL